MLLTGCATSVWANDFRGDYAPWQWRKATVPFWLYVGVGTPERHVGLVVRE